MAYAAKERWERVRAFWKVAGDNARIAWLQPEAELCLAREREAKATLEAIDRTEAAAKVESINAIYCKLQNVTLFCPFCKNAMEFSSGGEVVMCQTTHCHLVGMEFNWPTVEIQRRRV